MDLENLTKVDGYIPSYSFEDIIAKLDEAGIHYQIMQEPMQGHG